ncbi:TPA: hypothetical protein QDB40_003543 [Burkholderia vietnamiensis]|uniref:hypothetical protein n=1 Tax=Burkholderia cepacia TaxID=292 RepID=UPI0026537977|nr:hypothetical protein [Burkholderia cepacia]MDN7857964.1 hypothetical protein [Burkholderia cepacia]HDR9169546.1 hypothetical protein [Burkholderia vietnamiensis]
MTTLDSSTVSDWLFNQHVHVNPFVWTTKAAAFAGYVAMCARFGEPALAESDFWPTVNALLTDDPWAGVLMLSHRDVIHLAIDDVLPLCELDEHSDPFAPPTFAVLPSNQRARHATITDLTRERPAPPSWHPEK